MKIAIDIGHANHTGSTGNGMEEHTLCTPIAASLQTTLQRMGHQADIIDYPTLTNAADLAAAIRAINAGGYSIAISLHADAADKATARGGHVCFYPGSVRGRHLAESIAKHLCELMPGRADSIVSRSKLAILRKTTMPAVLVECGFITNFNDAQTLVQSPAAIARAIARGVATYTAEA